MSISWPPLPLAPWRDTLATLHRYAQIVGKIRLAQTPRVNHFWNVAFHLTARGWTSRPTPAPDGRIFEILFDFLDHQLLIQTSDGDYRVLALASRPVADFYDELMATLRSLGIDVTIDDHPVEIAREAIPFGRDRLHATYDPAAAHRCWRVVASSAAVLEEFRARFIGKCSPVHFFWGSFDLAVSRFSGRRAPQRAGADPITAESYSHEVASVGFWPGDERLPEPAYYSYFVPAPRGLGRAAQLPPGAAFSETLGEFVLPYDRVRRAPDPRRLLLEFCQSTYEAGATLAGWDRAALERQEPTQPAPEASAPGP